MKFEQVWKGRNCSDPETATFPASVPGNIQYDYGFACGFENVHFADRYKQYIPLENDAWEYSTVLKYQKKDGEHIFFVSEGIDYRYDILLNGEKIYSYEGMYRPVDVDLTSRLKGENDVLKVHIYPHPKSTTGRKDTRDEADESCKPAVCYGWDWNPRLLISGMWQDAYIETRDAFYIGYTEVLADLNEEMTEGSVHFSYTCEQPCETLLLDAEGREVYRGKDTEISVSSPELWWCNGQGNPYLYRWVIRNEKEERTGYIGFRKLRLVRNIGATDPSKFPKSRYDAPATVELNGRRILIKGSNWVNPELFWGQIDATRYDGLLILARDANMNMLRMWGGASVCKPAFYDLCDRYGILVWQEFMLACNNYLPTEHYLSVLEQEAVSIIRSLRHHPSLAFWCGGNELFNGWSGMDDQSPVLRLLNKLCYELDYSRPFLPTSPLIGMGHGGYTFSSDAQGGEVFQQFIHSHNTAYTEFGVPAVSSVETLREIIPADELFPIHKTEAWVAHHGFDAWGSDAWLQLPTWRSYFGEPESLEQLVEKSSWLQCAGYQAAFEEMRKQWPHCGMMLNWCFNEPWKTAANNSLIEYPAKPKPAYAFVKSALRPKLFSARIEKFAWLEGETFEAEIWLLNDSPEAVSGSVHISVCVGDQMTDLLDWKAETCANANKQGPTVRFVLPHAETDHFTLTLANDAGLSNSYCLQYRKKTSPLSSRMMNQ